MKISKTFLRGSSVLEITIAAALISIGLVGIISLATRSQRSTDFSKNNNLATNYSYQAIDWIRDLRNTLGYDTLIYYLTEDGSNPVIYCLNTNLPTTEANLKALTNSSCAISDHIPNTLFSREISIDLSNLASNYITAIATTQWEGNKTYTNTLEVKLTKWQ